MEQFPQTTIDYPPNPEWVSLKPRAVSFRPRVDFPQTTSRFPSDHESASLKPRSNRRNPLINGLKRGLQGIQVRLWWGRRAAKEGTVGSWRKTRSAASLRPRVGFPQTTSPPHYTYKWLRKSRR